MKAIIWHKYGPPDVLEYGDVEKPSPKDNEVLIKIHATTVTTGDCELRRYQMHPLFWLPIRIIFGIRKPKKGRRLGQEMAGEIESVGKNVKNFKIGDQVFGSNGIRMGCYAEYIAVPAKHPMAIRPSNMSFDEAAGIAVGGINALHFIRLAKIQRGEKVLIYGSTGTIGIFAVQLAKYFGAEVSAVCSATNSELVKSLGAIKTLDYLAEDFDKPRTYGDETYDVIFDTIGKSSFSRSKRSLKKNGRFIQANPTPLDMVRGIWPSMISGKKVIYKFAGESREGLNYLKELIEAGEIKVVIDSHRFSLEQIPDAHRYVEKGFKLGNVIVTVQHNKV